MKNMNLILDLPVYQEDLERYKAKRIRKHGQTNCMQEQILDFMLAFKLKDADMIEGTGIPWGTWHPIITGETEAPLADKNLLSLWQFMNQFAKVSFEWLLYGIGEMEPLPVVKEENSKTA
jgi:hypothetical protein